MSSDGELLAADTIKKNRTNITFENLPPYLVQGLVATEDVRFYDHSGIDGRSLARVLFKTIILRNENAGGGSTITQQLAKTSMAAPQQQHLSLGLIKFKEWITSAKLERRYTKEEIITMYFNTVEYVYDAYGIQTASKTFFNKDVDSLLIEEAATLVGMVNNPSYYNPVRYPDRTRDRRNVVLYQMKKPVTWTWPPMILSKNFRLT